MNMKRWLDEIIKSPSKKAMPILSFPAISLMDISVKDLISSSDLQANAMKIICDRVPSLASVSLMDLSLEAEAFGSQIRFSEDEIPTVIGSVVNSEEDAQNLVIPDVYSARCKIYIEAIRKACLLIQDRPVFAGVIGPFSLAGRLMDVSEAMINCYDDPDMVHITLKKVTEFLVNYINEYKKAGANGVVMAEPLAGMLSPALADEFSSVYVKEIAQAVQTDDFIVIYHNCGDNALYMIDSILSTGCSAYHFGDSIKMSEMLTHIPENTVAMGNISPSQQFRQGSAASIYRETTKLLEECSGYSNFVISSGCDIPHLSSWDNIDSFFKAVDDFYK